jgi:4-amino-4-deoxy-L-arabinose transferase-like glycosyltransferase
MIQKTWLSWSVLGTILLLGLSLALRLKGLSAESLSSDELYVLHHTLGVLESGYPHRLVGSFDYHMFTYELVPYPLAVMMGLFGMNDWALRLVGALFGVATTGLILWIGKQMFDRATGFFAALIYACSPWAIAWGQNLFHPGQNQFMALLTIYLFYRGAIESSELRPRYLYGAAAGFACTYLSWEGTGIILPAFLLALLVFRQDYRTWMKSGVLWTVALIVCAVVFLELCWRLTAIPAFLLIGEELRHHKNPELAFLLSDFDFWFFWDNFLWGEGRAPLTFLSALGLPLVRNDRFLAYLYLIEISLIILFQLLLEHLITHYYYFLFPGLILIAVRTLKLYLGSLGKLISDNLARGDRTIRYVLFFAAASIVFFATNDLAVQLYRLTYPSIDEPFHQRANFNWINYRGGDRFLVSQAGKSPILHTNGHHLYLFSGWNSNYNALKHPALPELYDSSLSPPRYGDKYIGTPILRRPQELEELFSQLQRLYIVLSPVDRFKSSNPEMYAMIVNRCQPIFYTYAVQVYLWRKY